MPLTTHTPPAVAKTTAEINRTSEKYRSVAHRAAVSGAEPGDAITQRQEVAG